MNQAPSLTVTGERETKKECVLTPGGGGGPSTLSRKRKSPGPGAGHTTGRSELPVN